MWDLGTLSLSVYSNVRTCSVVMMCLCALLHSFPSFPTHFLSTSGPDMLLLTSTHFRSHMIILISRKTTASHVHYLRHDCDEAITLQPMLCPWISHCHLFTDWSTSPPVIPLHTPPLSSRLLLESLSREQWVPLPVTSKGTIATRWVGPFSTE